MLPATQYRQRADPFQDGTDVTPSPSMPFSMHSQISSSYDSQSYLAEQVRQQRESNWSGGHESSGRMTPSGSAVDDGDLLAPPQRPFARSKRPSSISSDSGSGKAVSLSVNYVPNKFAKLHESGVWQHRQSKISSATPSIADDTPDDRRGVAFQALPPPIKKQGKLRWNRFKWALFVTNSIGFLCGMTALVLSLLVWLDIFYRSDVIRTGNRIELIISTTAAALVVLTSLIGFAGIILNNRPFLAVYNLLLWACLGLIVAPGYMTYKQRTFNLEGKINAQWSRKLGLDGRLRIQNALQCCGYYSPFVEATVSNLCYARSNQPGCKARYLRFERTILETWYICSFALVPVFIGIILAALLSSNHITYRFGKGLTPKRYRLDVNAMNVLMEEYSNQMAAMYGEEAAKEAIQRSSSFSSMDEKAALGKSSGQSTGVRDVPTMTYRPAAAYRGSSEDYVAK